MNTTHGIHVVIGAGQVGRKLAGELLERGLEVRIVRRGEAGPARPGLTWCRGDATDAAFMDTVCKGAEVIYHCANPVEYHKWDGIIQPLFHGIMGAAIRAGAKLVTLDNLYMYGRPDHSPFDESMPMRPCSQKGALRKDLVEQMLEAHQRGDLNFTSGRASDFFGPESELSMICSPRFFERLQKGQSLEYVGNPDLPRSYSFTPDVARGLAILGTSSKADGHIWHLPVNAGMTTRTLIKTFADATGHSGKMTKLPKWMFHVMGLFMPFMRGVPEMLYQWEVPYEIDDSAFRETFGVNATPLHIAVQETLKVAAPSLLGHDMTDTRSQKPLGSL
ncbi:MAG TPA: NAD-dependent epimerase [Myxococcales bacterium]|nr:NAD-dependent epimerase [Deltaproteobacteria bacterium]HAA57227.1 NAD-dependent epimerase [Myxococcales bacterium]|tara:strand:- start:10558 stop:11556 length:999 start_codon:yes stop_codon:yes gene_type:complete